MSTGITLYQWPAQGALPNAGLFCMKLESYLRLMKIEHRVHTTVSLKKSPPKKTMPYVQFEDGTFMSDSQLIIEHFELKSKVSLDAHLSAEQKSQALAYRILIEQHLVPIKIYFRWYTDNGWQQFSRVIFKGAPNIIRILVGGRMRRHACKTLHRSGISRHSEQELLSFARQDFAALSTQLGDKPFFFGSQPSLVDLVLFSIVTNLTHLGIDLPINDVVREFPNLIDHSNRLMKLIYS
jgi:glutathione S-transferase